MSHSEDERLPPELQDVARTLRARNPEATAVELDRIKRRAMVQASRATGQRPQRGMFMKSRGAFLTVLVMGAMLFGTGATLAATGNLPLVSDSSKSSPKSAQAAQYPAPPAGGVRGEERRSRCARGQSFRRTSPGGRRQCARRIKYCSRAKSRRISARQRAYAKGRCSGTPRARRAAARP